jgi:hypothetical protein
MLRKGVKGWNAYRSRLDASTAVDLTDANLAGKNLNGVNLAEANLAGADLSGACLWRAKLARANLTGANMRRADMRGADLTGARLTYAILDHANLTAADLTDGDLLQARLQGTNLTSADLRRANLTEAVFHETIFADTDLRESIGLLECVHLGPSVLDHRTLARCGDRPLKFLRGCGLPDRLIDYLPSLLEAWPVQFYSCFVSYSTHDQDFADRLYADLQAKGVRCWFAPHHLRPGKKIHEQIDEAIRVYDRLLLILSRDSMCSPWVKTEIAQARQKERSQNRRVLFPIRLVSFEQVRAWKQFDADLGDDSAREIREYYLPDFSRWKNQDAYQPAFDRLLSALEAETRAETAGQHCD